MTRPEARERPAWRVTIPAHRIEKRSVDGHPVGGHYEVPASSSVRFEETAESAIKFASVWAHIDARVPPWSPYLSVTVGLASAVRVAWTPGS